MLTIVKNGTFTFNLVDVPGTTTGELYLGSMCIGYTYTWGDVYHENGPEIAWRIFDEYQNKGLGYRGVKLLLRDLPYKYVQATIEQDNAPSCALAKKLGFKYKSKHNIFLTYVWTNPNVDT